MVRPIDNQNHVMEVVFLKGLGLSVNDERREKENITGPI